MAKKIIEEVSTSKREALKTLLKARAQTIYEREPVQAFAEGNLEILLDQILAL
jgi:hypothetical protein